MAEAGTIEVPVTYRKTIPFHEHEMFRVELGRSSIVRNWVGDTVHVVRGRDCDVIVAGNRVRLVQDVVVLDRSTRGNERIIGMILKVRRDKGSPLEMGQETLDELAALEAGFEAHFLVRDADGHVLRTYGLDGGRVLIHTEGEDGDDPVEPPRYVAVDLIGRPL